MSKTRELFSTSTITLVERVIANASDAQAKAELEHRSSWLAKEAKKFLAGALPKARLELHLAAAQGAPGAKDALKGAVAVERAKKAAAKAKPVAKAPAMPQVTPELMAAFAQFMAQQQPKRARKARKAA